ncbi:hypothetical protein BHAOGJBA_1135 [Methylobacterium hispanicum]|uniref:Uncharacterized protein n=1 Tax=Methylobacterium hispanicum TaxID=270350 RepID=A0AAV4ZIJ1_9HYPH|nr:hypothetical protein BHAOGJBA_1135 [Methylobacterium hispanicum]
MAKTPAGRSGAKRPWRPRTRKSRRPRKGVSPLRVAIAMAAAVGAGVWIGHFAQEYFNEGVETVAGVQKMPDLPPHPSTGPISFQ